MLAVERECGLSETVRVASPTQASERDNFIDEDEERVQRLSKFRQWAVVIACVPLVLLTGCPQQQAAPTTVPANATAPAIAAPAPGPTAAEIQAQAQAAATAARARKAQQLIDQAEATIRAASTTIAADGWRRRAPISTRRWILMLTSGMDLKSDPQLSDEFEHLLNAINSLEMTALKQGTDFPSRSKRLRSMPRMKLRFRPMPH